jgi:hypothetical protein
MGLEGYLQSMTKPSQFYWQWLLRTFRGKIGLAALVSGLLALVAQPVAAKLGFDNETVGWVPAGLFAGAFVLLLFVGLGRTPYEMFNELEVEKQKLKDQLFNRERRQAAIGRLWKLRERGVNLRNETPTDEAAWTAEYKQWRNQVLTDASIISANLTAWLDTLDRMRDPPKMSPSVSAGHAHNRQIMSEIMLRMEEFLKAEMLNKDIALSED